MSFLSIVMVLIGLFAGLSPASLRADDITHAGELTCEGNRAMLRVGWVGIGNGPANFPALPGQIAPFQVAPVDGNQCKLSDGREVRVKLGFEQTWPYGECGGGLNSFLSLWVDGKKVLSRQPALAGCFWDGHRDILVLDGQQLTLCTSPEAVEFLADPPKTTGCVDASPLLQQALPDATEYPADPASQPGLGSLQITLNQRPDLCEAFLSDTADADPVVEAIAVAQQWDSPFNPIILRQAAIRDEAQFSAAWPTAARDFVVPASATEIAFAEGPSDSGSAWPPNFTWQEMDFDNDGTPDFVLKSLSRTHADDADGFYVVPSAVAAPVKSALKDTQSNLPFDPLLAALLADPAVHSYADAFGDAVNPDQSRYTYQFAFTYSGETFVFATPINRHHRPTATIYKPLPDGHSEQVCLYQRVEENY